MRASVQAPEPLCERIVREGTRLFAKHGFAATSMRELAAAAGCTKPALYHYFANKDALFVEIMNVHSRAIEAFLRDAAEGRGPMRERIHTLADAFIAYAQRNADAMKLMLRLDGAPDDSCPDYDATARRELHMGLMTKMFERARREGEVRTALDPHDGALVLAGALHFQFAEAIVTSCWDTRRYHRVIDLLFEGIAP